MKPLSQKTLNKALISAAGLAAFLAIGGYIGSKYPQTAAVSKTNSTFQASQSEASSPSNRSKYVATIKNESHHCKDNQRYLLEVVKDALKSQLSGNKILKIGETKPASPNPYTQTMGGKVVASCTTDIYASFGGLYPVEWNVELDGNQYYVVTAPLLNSTQKQAVQEINEW
ncbi:hypothetical protein [Synechococcus sp. UW69]|uniref:hypothetical protein n=1 Tax=Synechococcus sp. UW69 TaxID=368493 RepID=UPI0010BD1A1E|nr:hypothetical protein [Synechococcus sp. UW69]